MKKNKKNKWSWKYFWEKLKYAAGIIGLLFSIFGGGYATGYHFCNIEKKEEILDLNLRHYNAIVSLKKEETIQTVSDEQIRLFIRNYNKLHQNEEN